MDQTISGHVIRLDNAHEDRAYREWSIVAKELFGTFQFSVTETHDGKMCRHPTPQVTLTIYLLGQLHRREVECLDCGEKWEEVPVRTVTTWRRKNE